MQRRTRKNSVVRAIIIVLFIASVMYVLRAAIGEQLEASYSNQTLVQAIFGYQFPHLLLKHTFTVALVLWTFAFGASIGSFLNVVVYRMPRGESLNKRGSHCPYCNQPIRLRDNVPVFGWLNLRGRCRVCRLPISSRYPMVEFITGAAFVVFLLYEVASGGAFLPRFETVTSRDALIGIFSRDIEDFKILLGMFALHMFAVLVLWSATLIERDRNDVPGMLMTVPLAIIVIVASIWPGLLPVEWYAYSRLASLPNQSLLVADHFSSFVGLVFGAGQGFVIDSLINRSVSNELVGRRQFNRSRLVFSLATGLVGATFGWQAIMLISLPLVVSLYFVRVWQHGRTSRTGIDRYGLLLLLVVAHWVFWKATHGGFETGISGAPFLMYGLIATGFAGMLSFPSLRNAYDPTVKSDLSQ